MEISAEFLSFLLTGTLTPILTWLLFALLQRGRKQHARVDPGSGDFVLEYGRGVRRFPLYVGLFWAVFLAAIILWQGVPTGSDLVWFAVVLVVVAVPLTGFVIEVYGLRYRVNGEGIRKISPWSRDYFLPWREIQRIQYSGSVGGYVIRSWRGKIRVSSVMDGYDDFIDLARLLVPEERWHGPN